MVETCPDDDSNLTVDKTLREKEIPKVSLGRVWERAEDASRSSVVHQPLSRSDARGLEFLDFWPIHAHQQQSGHE